MRIENVKFGQCKSRELSMNVKNLNVHTIWALQLQGAISECKKFKCSYHLGIAVARSYQ